MTTRTRSLTIEDYLQLPYHFSLYQDQSADGPYWAAQVVELKGCAGHGDTPDEALACVRESMRRWIEVAIKVGNPVPLPAKSVVPQYSAS